MKRLLVFVMVFAVTLCPLLGDDGKKPEAKKLETEKGVTYVLLIGAPYGLGSDPIKKTITSLYWNFRGAGVAREQILVIDDKDSGAYPVHGVTCIENIRLAFDVLSQESTDDDTVIVHFAGHGNVAFDLNELREGAYFYVQVGMTDKEIKGRLEGIRARRIIVTLDSCSSGVISAYVGGGRIVAATPCTGSGRSHQNFSQLFITTFYTHLCAGESIGRSYEAARCVFESVKGEWNAKNSTGNSFIETICGLIEYPNEVFQNPSLTADEEKKEEVIFPRR